MPDSPPSASSPCVSDGELTGQAAQGDTSAFRQLMERHERRVTGFACRLLDGDAATAEDVAQEVWVALWQTLRMGRYMERGMLTAYLLRAVRNRCHDLARAAHPTVPLEDADAIAAPDAGTGAVRDAIARLPDVQQAVLLLHYYEGASYEEIAQVLHCAPGTVASRLHTARATLKRLLTEEMHT